MNQDYQVLTQDLRSLGLQKDDSVLILSSYRSMNGLEGGKTVGSGDKPDPNFYDRTIFLWADHAYKGCLLAALLMNLQLPNQGVAYQSFAIGGAVMKTDGGDGPVFIGGVVIDAFVAAAAGAVQSVFVLILTKAAAAQGLRYGLQNVKELADAAFFCVTPQRMELGKCRPDEPGPGAEVSG